MSGIAAKTGGPVVVHSLAHALAAAAAAAAAGKPLDLVSVAGCGSAAGTGWFTALGDLVVERYPELSVGLTLDCGDEPGVVLGALRRGLKSIVFTGNPLAAARLDDIAAQRGAVIRRARPVALDLIGARNPRAACAGWFTPGTGAGSG